MRRSVTSLTFPVQLIRDQLRAAQREGCSGLVFGEGACVGGLLFEPLGALTAVVGAESRELGHLAVSDRPALAFGSHCAGVSVSCARCVRLL